MRAALVAGVVLALHPAAAGERRVLDDFTDVSAWVAAPSDGVSLKVSGEGGALRLDFDFHGGGGYAVARSEIPIEFPANWALSFRIRGDAPENNLEVKFADASGDNVWWRNVRGYAFPREWAPFRIKKRQVEYAWGPLGGGALTRSASFELAVTAGRGGKGTVWIDDLVLTELPPDEPYSRTPEIGVSSGAASGGSWRSDPAGGDAQSYTLDFLVPRELGGLVVDWDRDDYPERYAVEISADGTTWTGIRHVDAGAGGRAWLYLPETEARFIRLRLERSSRGRGYALERIEIEPLEFAASPNAFFEAIARDARRGLYPRYFQGQLVYWTVVGTDGDREEALVNEDGAIEPFARSFSVEPFVVWDGALVTWNDVARSVSLDQGYLPIPSVHWAHPALALDVTALADGVEGRSTLLVRYRLRNVSKSRSAARLALAVRPFQVDPPSQFLGTPGGVTPIRTVAWDGARLVVDGRGGIEPDRTPARVAAATFDEGDVVAALAADRLARSASVEDPFEHASGLLAWDAALGPGEVLSVTIAIPQSGPGERPDFETCLARTRAAWKEKLGRVAFRAPPEAATLVRTIRSSLAWILINKDGPAIQPGSRSYERSWIRDGSLTSAALLRLGHAADVKRFLEWFSPFQYPDGKVPCCVDARGADPVPENDSHGELIYLAAEYFRFTGDRATIEGVWPHIEKAVAYIDLLRSRRRTEEYRTPDKLAYFGLLPESISHEGYSDKPVHSYWDDFFALKGLKDAVELAEALGKGDRAEAWARIRDELREDVHASVRRTIEKHGIDYLPGCVEKGDFDPTSTTTALAPGGETARLPRKELERTFERYWLDVAKRRADPTWDAYTPYELRTVGAMIRLGRKDRALALLDGFLADRRPPAWNQWAEVVWRDPLRPKFIGDMPHGWVASDFVRSALDLFAYDREEDGALVVGAGIAAAWARAEGGIAVRRLPTRHGTIDLAFRASGRRAVVRVGGAARVPAGGIAVRSPLDGVPARVTIDGRDVPAAASGEAVVRSLPAEVAFTH